MLFELITTSTLCFPIGDGHFVCPDRPAIIVAADDPITVHVRDPEATSGGGWDCSDGWCSFDYGLATDDDTIPLPSSGGTTCEDAPASCDGQDPEPPPPPSCWWSETGTRWCTTDGGLVVKAPSPVNK